MTVVENTEAGVASALKIKTVEQAKKLMQGHSGTAVVSGISLVESALPVPLITDPFLVAAILVDRSNAWRVIIITTLTSALGGLFAYFSAVFFLEFILQYLTPSMQQELSTLSETGGGSTFLLTLLGAVTPIPYTIVAWAVATLKGNAFVFLLASILGRGFRYTVVGYCAYRFGPLAVAYARRYIWLASIVLVALATLYVWYKFL